MWRWDQGRLLYFQFDVLKRIAPVLVKFNGVRISDCESVFRSVLMSETAMPFAPADYAVLRNYKRVFECAFLATVSDDKKLIVSDFCLELAKENSDFANADDYLLSYISRFRFPFPAFEGYNTTTKSIYPFCAIVKYLISLAQRNIQPNASIDDIFNLIIANRCTGYENLDYFSRLTPQPVKIGSTQKRQLREMVIFISQLSFLKVYDGKLWLDTANRTALDELVTKFLEPKGVTPKENRMEEFLSLAGISTSIVLPTIEIFTSESSDIEFIEGKRKRVEHFRIDRSPLLRRYYREKNAQPTCNMCLMDVSAKYPWTDYMLDIHHLLPLSSSLALTNRGTSVQDIVGLCPTCHRSIHIYYTKWLREKNQDDFLSQAEAMDVYLAATKEIT